MEFKDDKEALAFLAQFVSSDIWKWFEQVIRSRFELIVQKIAEPKTTADGRAMLNGRLIELHELLEFPVKSFLHFKGQEAMRAAAEKDPTMNGQQKASMVARVANPDIITH